MCTPNEKGVQAEKLASNRRVAGTPRRKLRKPASKMPYYLLKNKRPWELAMKEKDEREGKALLQR